MNIYEPVTQLEIDQRVFDLYDEYCHGRIDRREFLARAAARGGRPGHGAGAAAALRRGADDLVHGRADQGAVRELSVAGRQLRGRCAATWCSRQGAGPFPAVLVIHENRGLNPVHRGRGAPRRGRGLPRARARRPVPGRRLSGQRRRRPHAAGESRPGQAAHRHAQQRALPEVAQAVHRQARRHGLLLGRRHDQFPRDGAGRRHAGGRAVLRRGAPRRRACRRSRRRC